MAKPKGPAKRAQYHIDELSVIYQQERQTAGLRSERYLYLIRRLGMKFRLSLPRDVKHSYCKHCKTPFLPGKNCRMRTRGGILVFYCFTCKNYTRLPLNKEHTK
ncbi:hypothetical protein K9M74_00430 [Candidatus Woesearchaeota archaeon]|nr:hypothetical protein [Candidatus Woesearchaeota archaeon]